MIGQRVKMARMTRGLSQAELARQVGISRVALVKIETGETSNMSAKTAVALAKALGITTDFLLCVEC